MSSGLLGMMLDGLVLLFLAATIFFAVRLSVHLRQFREGRKDLEKLVGDLGSQIAKAEKSIETLKDSARDASRSLQQQLDEARAVADDLEIMTRGANNIADRLDRSAERHRGSTSPVQENESARGSRKESDGFPGFAIRDAEAERQDRLSGDGAGSVAERELMEALQSRKGRG
ncbi:MAG: DUF6468 domain-containing protein [Micavibrio sp.]